MLKVGIIGCGKMGYKRADNLGVDVEFVSCADSSADACVDMALKYNVDQKTVAELIKSDVDIVIVATPHHALAQLALEAVDAGKHVLIEKPGAIKADDLRKVFDLALEKNVQVSVGYTLRHHQAVQLAYERIQQIAPLFFVRAHYGHGGRLGYEKEWRSSPEQSGGGVLMDLGVHLIDLSRMFLGEFTDVRALLGTYFWDAPVEDNAFVTLNNGDTLAQLHVSATEWRNSFEFEIVGMRGKLVVNGLGGSYGPEWFSTHYMRPDMQPPIQTRIECRDEDYAWKAEWDAFVANCQSPMHDYTSLINAIANLRIVEQIYDYHKIAA